MQEENLDDGGKNFGDKSEVWNARAKEKNALNSPDSPVLKKSQAKFFQRGL